jgi:preprotein translocase subunit Sec63
MNQYEILGVRTSDTMMDIKKRYKELCKKHHPDVGGNIEYFHTIQKAYNDIVSGKVTESILKPNGHLVHTSLFSFKIKTN